MVLLQGASFGKGLVAHRAGVRLLTSVHHLVHLQIASFRYGLVGAGAGLITLHKLVLLQNAICHTYCRCDAPVYAQ
jgi:hypothetical protein